MQGGFLCWVSTQYTNRKTKEGGEEGGLEGTIFYNILVSLNLGGVAKATGVRLVFES